MNPRLRAQVVKELLSFLRDPRMRLVLIGPPLLQLVVFSFAVTLDVRNVDVAVYDEDGGVAAHEFVQRIAASSFPGSLTMLHDQGALRRAIDARDAIAVVHLPPHFSADLAAGRTATVQVVLDGRRANASQIVLAYLNQIVSDLNADLADPSGRALGSRAAPLTSVRHWFNPELEYQWFVVPSLSGILAMLSALVVTSLSIAREREMGTFDQLLVSAARPIEIIIGKTLPAVLIGSVLATLMVAAAVGLFGVPFTGSLALLFGALVLFIFSVVGVGLMISSVCQTQQQAILGTFAAMVPVILISGFATPVENMPHWLQVVAEASPLKHFLIIVRGSFVKALPPSEILANAWPLAAITVVTMGLAITFVSRRLQ